MELTKFLSFNLLVSGLIMSRKFLRGSVNKNQNKKDNYKYEWKPIFLAYSFILNYTKRNAKTSHNYPYSKNKLKKT